MSKTSHIERTAAEPRDASLNEVTISQITQPSLTTRIFRLDLAHDAPPIRFLPGQFVDVYCPDIAKPGGFTITSPPSAATAPTPAATTSTESAKPHRFIELAIQSSPDNPAAAYLWQDTATLLGSTLRVRTGGSFVYPPPGILPFQLRKLVFVAGGMGINPLMSMLSHLAELPAAQLRGMEVRLLYSVKNVGENGSEVLFLERLAGIFAAGKVRGRMDLFVTGGEATKEESFEVKTKGGEREVYFEKRRIGMRDIVEAVGADARFAAVYVCGVPGMTDEFVAGLTDPKGTVRMEKHRVLFEKWW